MTSIQYTSASSEELAAFLKCNLKEGGGAGDVMQGSDRMQQCRPRDKKMVLNCNNQWTFTSRKQLFLKVKNCNFLQIFIVLFLEENLVFGCEGGF